MRLLLLQAGLLLLLSGCAARPLTLDQAQEQVRRSRTPKEFNKRYYRAYRR